MSTSFMCPNCGIKVSTAEETGCPGCGHQQSDSLTTTEARDQSGSTINPASSGLESPFQAVSKELEWVNKFLKEAYDEFIEEFDRDHIGAFNELHRKTVVALHQAPNEESKRALHAGLAQVCLELKLMPEALENAKFGVLCKTRKFRDGAYMTLLEVLRIQELNDELKLWIEKAREDNFPHVRLFDMHYSINMGLIQEALDACEDYYAADINERTYTRAGILLGTERKDEAEVLFRKVISQRGKTLFAAGAANSLAFSILIPQKRYLEAEICLTEALSTTYEYEKINAYSNLVMVAFHLKEYNAAKRYATVGTRSGDLAIISESRLTLCKIEHQKLIEIDDSNQKAWGDFLDTVLSYSQDFDMDDAAEFFKYLIIAVEKSGRSKDIVEIIDSQYQIFRSHKLWLKNDSVREQIELSRIEKLSEIFLKERRYLELDVLFTEFMSVIEDRLSVGLLNYLRTPFAGIEIRRAATKIRNLDFIESWAFFETIPEILIELSKHPEEVILLNLAENPATPLAACKLIANQKDLDLDFALSKRASLDAEVARLLVESNFDGVRKVMAERSDLDEDLYQLLATDGAVIVRDAIRENSVCSPEIKALAALGSL